MKVLDLFSGIGGFSLGLERAGMETIAFCEIEDYPRRVLAKHWPDVPIASDVTKLTYQDGALYDYGKEIYRGSIDVVCGGFPCQDISVAGKQEGIKEGTRSGLWSECARLLREIRPDYAIFENVTALLSGEKGRWFQRVLWDISKVGYDAEWHCIPASYLGACHRRDRVWVIAYPSCSDVEAITEKPIFGQSKMQRELGRGFERVSKRPDTSESLLFREDDGLPLKPYRNRVKALGNTLVPQIPELIGRAINPPQS
jgi:DNA (cytosine-5)-methyltransferase 1